MSQHPRDGKLLYHMTSMQNLGGVLQHGLLSRASLKAGGASFRDVADPEILEGRAQSGLDAYVPFHFFAGNPFDYAIRKKCSDRLMILAVNRTLAAQQKWLVIARHPLAEGASPDLLDWKKGIEEIDWEKMTPGEHRNYLDRDTKLTCMAEALKLEKVPVGDFASIFVANDTDKKEVEAALPRNASIYVNVLAAWFNR